MKQLWSISNQMVLGAFVFALVCLGLTNAASAATLPSTISSNTTLTTKESPYTGGWVSVSSGVTLTLQPGVIVKIWGGLTIQGTLRSEGTAENSVTFTSLRDDSAGGDTNGDGSMTQPKPGDWAGMEFPEESGNPSAPLLEHTKVLYGGEKSYPFHAMVDIRCPCANAPEIVESTIAHSYTRGIQVRHGSPAIIRSNIESNAETGIEALFSGAPEIRENIITENSLGVYLLVGEKEHGAVMIDGNHVERNTEAGIEVSAPTGYDHIDSASLGENVVKENGGKAIVYEAFANSNESPELANNPIPKNITTNTLEKNGKNGLWVSGQITESESWGAPSYALVVFGGGLSIPKGSTLTIEPGAVIKNEGRSVYVKGTLDPDGNVEEAVTFTSIKDDTVAGDTNGDGVKTSPNLGDWEGIEYPSTNGAELSYLDIRYAKTAVDIDHLSWMTISNSDFVYNAAAIKVAETAEDDPALGALSCVPPYMSYVLAAGDWFGEAGYPTPDIDISGAVGAEIPGEYAPLFGAASSLAELTVSSYGGDNTIPFAIYSCPALSIPPIPVTPVLLEETPPEPLYPDPEVP